MRNLSEEIIDKYLTGKCSQEELIEVNAWMNESEENACQLFRMEEVFHLGKFDTYADEQRMANAEKRLYRKLEQEKKKKDKVLYMHRCFINGRRSRILVLQPDGTSDARGRCQ